MMTGGLIITQRPYQSSCEFSTIYQDVDTSRPYGVPQRGSGLLGDDSSELFPLNPLGNFNINFVAMEDADWATLNAFFVSMAGRYGEFIFLDPNGNLINNSEDFTKSTWNATSVSIGLGTTDPFGGGRATLLTATSTNSNFVSTVLPLGSASGQTLTASVYVKPSSSGQSMCIGFVDSGFSVLANTITPCPVGKWTRIQCTIELATSSYIRVLIGGFGTWNSTTVALFGPQCSPLPDAGGYVKSPDNYGYHPTCRFDADVLTRKTIGPNQNSTSIPVVEYSS